MIFLKKYLLSVFIIITIFGFFLPFTDVSPITADEDSNIILVHDEFFMGADLSSLPQVESIGTKFFLGENEEDIFTVLNTVGFSYGRLRLWHTPGNEPAALGSYCDLNHTIDMAVRMKNAGWKYLLDFHYSDWWADPSQQTKPKAWENLTFEELNQSLYDYTYNVLTELNNYGVLPDMIQVGNEISHGFLWPDGGLNYWSNFSQLLNTSVKAIKEFMNHLSLPIDSIPIMLHFAPGSNCTGYQYFFDEIQNYDVPYDIIGLSYYPTWHGTLTNLKDCLRDLVSLYNKSVAVVETNYGWTFDWNDSTNNLFWTDDLHSGFPATPEGQRAFYEAIIQIVVNLPNNKGVGVMLWEPAWVTPCEGGSALENVALFDFSNELLPIYNIPLIKYAPPIDDSTNSARIIGAHPIIIVCISIIVISLTGIKIEKNRSKQIISLIQIHPLHSGSIPWYYFPIPD
jgi:arabinogalactan endo-1,4-beta-galactosidase